MIIQFMETSKKTIGDMFDETVKKLPDKEALIYQGQNVTYGQLAHKVECLAKSLIDLGVEPGRIAKTV